MISKTILVKLNQNQYKYSKLVLYYGTSSVPSRRILKQLEGKKTSEVVRFDYDSTIFYNSYLEQYRFRLPYYVLKRLEEKNIRLENRRKYEESLPVCIEKVVKKYINNEKIQKLFREEKNVPESYPYGQIVHINDNELKKISEVIADWDHIADTIKEETAYRIKAYDAGLLQPYITDEVEDISKTSKSGFVDLSAFIPDMSSGSADPSFPSSNVPCGGCGALLHCQSSSFPGFIPSVVYTTMSKEELNSCLCQRCYMLKYLKRAVNVRVDPNVYTDLLMPIKEKVALVLILIDLLDFPCSLWPNIIDIVGKKRPVIIVGNKVDLLPADGRYHLSNIKKSLQAVVEKSSLCQANIIHYSLVSGHSGYGIEQLITKIHDSWGYKGDIYIVGCTNVGKSTFFNCLLQSDLCKTSALDRIMRATTSPWPGTTLNMLKFPILRPSGKRLYIRMQRLSMSNTIEKKKRDTLPEFTTNKDLAILSGNVEHSFKELVEPDEAKDSFSFKANKIYKPPKKMFGINPSAPDFVLSRWCYDTPGSIQPDQLINLLTHEELLKVLPRRFITPQAFSITRGKSLFIAGLARIDYLYGPIRILVTVFRSNMLPVSVVQTEKASELYHQHLGSPFFGVPFGSKERLSKWFPLKAENIRIYGKGEWECAADVVLSSAGWISVSAKFDFPVELRAWTPGARGIYVRDPPLLPRMIKLKGRRVKHTPVYRMRKLYVPRLRK